MAKLRKDVALKTAVEIVKENIQASSQWVAPETIVDAIEKIKQYLESTEVSPGDRI